MFGRAKQPQAPPRVPSDTVIPFHFKDNTILQGVIIDFAFVFDDVLDPEKIHAAWERMVENHGDWRKLGARIRKNKEGNLEFHIPESYNRATRPSCDFQNHVYDMPAAQHPGGAQIPRAGPVPSTAAMSDELKALTTPHGMPTIDYWLYSDKPCITVTVTSFTDTTIVGMRYSHAVMDGVGHLGVFRAWTAELAGRPDQVQPFVGFREDPIVPIMHETPGEKYLLYDQRASTWSFARFAIGLVWELMTKESDGRFIFLPGAYMAELRRDAVAHIEQVYAGSGTPPPQISEGDLLMAWWAKRVAAALAPKNPNTPIAISNAVDIRDFVPGISPPGAMYMGNALDSCITMVPARELVAEPLGATALRTRNDILRLRTKEQIQAKMALDLAAKGTQFIGPADQIQLLITNWHKIRLFHWDYSPAVVESPATKGRTHRPGFPTSLLFNTGSRFQLSNTGPIMGKDGEGNWWMGWRLRSSAWPAIEEELKRMGLFGWHPPPAKPKSRL